VIPRPEDLKPTPVFNAYWHFAAERLAIYYRRIIGDEFYTNDYILSKFRFTNSYRAADRVSQYLIRNVQYAGDQAPRQVIGRTLLFKFFNKIETWEVLRLDGPKHTGQSAVACLDDLFNVGISVYNPAYIMSSPPYGCERKHQNHIALLMDVMDHAKLEDATSLQNLYERLLAYPGLGKFLAFQFAIDLNYSSAFEFDEADFVIAGPGALDGISKCFADTGGYTAEQIIHGVTEAQWRWFAELGIDFPGLYGRPLQPIDCQNLFCEISKYARKSHPEYPGVAGRTEIKQKYLPHAKPFPQPMFPPRWNLNTDVIPTESSL